MTLTAAELKEIRAVMCSMAERGCIAAQLARARADLVEQFLVLKAATLKPAAAAK